jgi:hypothetical protein
VRHATTRGTVIGLLMLALAQTAGAAPAASLEWLVKDPAARLERPTTLHEDNLLPDYDRPTNTCWRRAGTCGAEFAAGGAGALASAVASVFGVYVTVQSPYWDGKTQAAATCWYAGTNALLTSSMVWGTGSLLGQHGKWYASCAGAVLGSVVGTTAFFLMEESHRYPPFEAVVAVTLVPPALGATLFMNLWHPDDDF